MKIKIDDELILEITPSDRKSLLYKTKSSELDQSIKDMVRWWIQSHLNQAIESIKKEWLPILFKRYPSIPTDDTELANLIFNQPDYIDQDMREAAKAATQSANFKVT